MAGEYPPADTSTWATLEIEPFPAAFRIDAVDHVETVNGLSYGSGFRCEDTTACELSPFTTHSLGIGYHWDDRPEGLITGNADATFVQMFATTYCLAIFVACFPALAVKAAVDSGAGKFGNCGAVLQLTPLSGLRYVVQLNAPPDAEVRTIQILDMETKEVLQSAVCE